MERWLFEVAQDGMVVVSGDCQDKDSAMKEAMHYLMMYGEGRAIVCRAGNKKRLAAMRRLIRASEHSTVKAD